MFRVNQLAGFGAAKAGAAVWTPAQLPGLSFWYDPANLSSLDQVSGGGTPVTANNDPVGLMQDLSGNSRHVSQATSGSRPLWKTSGGLSWLEFDGTDDKLTRSETNVPCGTAIIGAYAASTNSLFTGFLTNLTDQAADVDLAFTDRGNTTFGQWDTGTWPGSDLFDGTHVWKDKVQTDLMTLDAVHVYSGDGTSNPGTLQFPTGITVGADRNNGRFLIGRIYGVIVCSGILSSTDRNLAETWMGTRCGLSI